MTTTIREDRRNIISYQIDSKELHYCNKNLFVVVLIIKSDNQKLNVEDYFKASSIR